MADFLINKFLIKNHKTGQEILSKIKNIAYLSELPTASEDSADFVSINNVLYAKQVNNGVYSYAELGAGGTTVIEKTLNEEGTDFIDTFTEEDIDKLIGGALLKAKANEFASYYLTPMIAQQTDEGVKGVGLGGFLDAETGSMLMVNVMTMNGQVRTQVYTTEGFGGEGVEIINADMSWMTSATTGVIPSQYRDVERLKKALVAVNNGTSNNYTNVFRYAAEDNTYFYSVAFDTQEGSQYIEQPLIKINKSNWNFELTQISAIDHEYLKGQIELYSGKPITEVSALPTANEEEFEKGKIYTTEEALQYISKKKVDAPTFGQISSLPTAIAGAAAAAVGNDIYILGGRTAYTTYSSDIYKYSAKSNTITKLSTTLPTPVFSANAVAVGSDIYIFGGRISNDPENYTNQIWKFSTSTGNVITLSKTMPSVIGNYSVAVVGTDIYIFGGRKGNYYDYNIVKYETITDTLTTLSTKLPYQMGNTTAVAIGTNIYVLGGQKYDNDATHTIYKYDTTTGVITTSQVSLNNGASVAAAAIGTDIYIFGGYNSYQSSPTSSIRVYSTTNDTLSDFSNRLPTAICFATAVSIGSNIYIFGGSNSNLVSNNAILKLAFGFDYFYKTLATKTDLENLGGIEIIDAEKEFTVSNIQTDEQGEPVSIEGNIPEKYRDVERLSKAIVLVGGQIFRCEEVGNDNMKFTSISPYLEDEGGTLYVLYYVHIFMNTWNFAWWKHTVYNERKDSGLNEQQVQTLIDNAIGTTLQGEY